MRVPESARSLRSGRAPERVLELRSFAFDRLSAIAAVLDDGGVIVDTNEAWRLFSHLNGGSARTTGLGVNYLGVCDRAAAAGCEDAAEIAVGVRQILAGDRQRLDHDYPCASEIEDRWFMLSAAAAPVANGAGIVLFHVDVTARKLLEQRLCAESEHDELTGLPNRRSAVRYIEQHLAESRITGALLWVLFFDLNGFKAVNDTYGHHAGDELLVKVAARARRALRQGDLLSRFGGDEFVVVCPGLTSEGAEAIARRLTDAMAQPFQFGASEVSITTSLGLACSKPESTVDSLLKAADAQMYRQKIRRKP
ncbi:MAG: GGDEF domain-containing protein [Acidimicrobiales bacterium]